MALTTTSQIAGPVNYKFQEKLLRQAQPRCVYFAGSMEGSVLPSHSGTFSVKWRRYDALTPTVSALSEITGSATHPLRSGSTMSVTDPTATVSKYGAHVSFSEEADLVNSEGEMGRKTFGLVSTLGIQAGRSLNRLQRNILEDNATPIYTSGASANSGVVDPITLGVIEQATNAIETNSAITFAPKTSGSTAFGSAPVGEAYWGFCHTHVKPDIRKIPGFISVERYASQTQTVPGEFGAVGDVRWISSPEASIDTGSGGNAAGGIRTTTGSVDIYTSIVFGMDFHGALSLDRSMIREVYMAGDEIPAIILIHQPMGSAGTGDPLRENASFGWKSWHGGKVLNANWGRGIRSGASKLS